MKPAATTPFGSVTGYFADPDGYLWEVTWSDQLRLSADGSVIME